MRCESKNALFWESSDATSNHLTVVLILLLTLGLVAAEFQTKEAQQAAKRYTDTLAKLEKEREEARETYARDLEAAMIAATQAGDLDEANRIKAERDAVAAGSEDVWPADGDDFAKSLIGTRWEWDGGPNVLTFERRRQFSYTGWRQPGTWRSLGSGHIEAMTYDGRRWDIMFSRNGQWFMCTSNEPSARIGRRIP